MATPRKCPGRAVAFEAQRDALGLDPGREARRVHLAGIRREQQVDARSLCNRRVALEVTRVCREIPGCRSNWAAFTKRLATRTSDSARAAAKSASWPACSAPIVGTRPTTPRRGTSSLRRSTGRRSRLGRLHERGVERLEPGCRATAARWRSTVSQSPRATGPVSSKPFSIVRSISGMSAAGGAPAVVEELGGGAVERHEIVRRDGAPAW